MRDASAIYLWERCKDHAKKLEVELDYNTDMLTCQDEHGMILYACEELRQLIGYLEGRMDERRNKEGKVAP